MSSTRKRRWAGGLLSAVAAGVLITVVAGPASAHVEVYSGQGPVKGDDGVVQLTVPVEEDDANTVGLTLTLPAGVNLSSASVLPLPGWSSTVQTVDDGKRVTRIVWRADNPKRGGLAPGQFGIFTFSAGPWPTDRNSVAIPATQTYSNGTVVQWNQVAIDAAAEPDHPALIVELSNPSSAAETTAAHTVSADQDSGSSAANVGQWVLLALAVVLAAGSVAVSVTTRRRVGPGGGSPA